jgi:LuxR family maltose regulon positive regulatory protein
MIDRVLSELTDAGGDITLMIDDLHELNCPDTFAQLTYLLTNLPPRVHAVLASGSAAAPSPPSSSWWSRD